MYLTRTFSWHFTPEQQLWKLYIWDEAVICGHLVRRHDVYGYTVDELTIERAVGELTRNFENRVLFAVTGEPRYNVQVTAKKAEVEATRRWRERHKHPCATCDTLVSKHATHCRRCSHVQRSVHSRARCTGCGKLQLAYRASGFNTGIQMLNKCGLCRECRG